MRIAELVKSVAEGEIRAMINHTNRVSIIVVRGSQQTRLNITQTEARKMAENLLKFLGGIS